MLIHDAIAARLRNASVLSNTRLSKLPLEAVCKLSSVRLAASSSALRRPVMRKRAECIAVILKSLPRALPEQIVPQLHSAQIEASSPGASAYVESSVIYCRGSTRQRASTVIERAVASAVIARESIAKRFSAFDRVRLPAVPRHASDGSAKLRNDVAPGEQQRVAR
jgi:hypothetical protein